MKGLIKKLLRENLISKVNNITENKKYSKKDIEEYDKLHKKHKAYKNNHLNIEFNEKDPLIDDLKKVDFPSGLFSYLMDEKRPDLVDYLPYEVKLFSTECDEFPKGFWTNKDGFLGLNDGPKLRLFLPVHKKIEILPTLWMLFHEFRHKMQHKDKNIESLTSDKNPNKKKFFDFIGKEFEVDREKINHVFHEIDPMEIDANIFACEILGIKYNGSGKFDITPTTLKKLKNNTF